MVENQPITHEFSRTVETSRLGDEDIVREISARPDECATLADRFGLIAIERLAARLSLHRTPNGALRLRARLSANVIQSCVVTLVPVPARIEEEFTLLYMPDAPSGSNEVVDVDAATEDAVEPWPGRTLDIGEAVAQQLALALDPYPRAPRAAVDPRWTTGAPVSGDRPFAKLAGRRAPKRK